MNNFNSYLYLSVLVGFACTNAWAMLTGTGTPPFDIKHPMLYAWYEAGDGVNTKTPSDGDAVTQWQDISDHERYMLNHKLDALKEIST